jgi:medium-chain acyl-[acyl-carrier-protein] hydrolase
MTIQPVSRLWVRIPKPDPRAPRRLFCFPHAGGGASLFQAWPSDSGVELEVCAVQLPGREDRLREPPPRRLLPLAEALAEELLPFLDRPFVFFGHSAGALLAFETIRQLRRNGATLPDCLFVSGCRAPQLPDSTPPIHAMSDARFLDEIRRLNGTPDGVLRDAQLLELLLPTLRADFEVVETYVFTPEEPLACPISAFGGLADGWVSRGELAAWRKQTSGWFEVRWCNGGHFFPYEQTQRSKMLAAMTDDVRRGSRGRAV